MTLYDLRIIDPDRPTEYGPYLHDWSDLTVSVDRKAPGILNFTYPKFGPQRQALLDNQILVFLQDGHEADNCRFVLRNLDGQAIGPMSLHVEFRQLPTMLSGDVERDSRTVEILLQTLDELTPRLPWSRCSGRSSTGRCCSPMPIVAPSSCRAMERDWKPPSRARATAKTWPPTKS